MVATPEEGAKGMDVDISITEEGYDGDDDIPKI